MTICTGCEEEIILTPTNGWENTRGSVFCGPGRVAFHLPPMTKEEIAADAREFVDDLRRTAVARDRFKSGERLR